MLVESRPVVPTRLDNWRPFILTGVVALLYMCAFLDRNAISLLVDPIKTDLGISDVEISLALGVAFSVFISIFTLPAGLVVDRYERR